MPVSRYILDVALPACSLAYDVQYSAKLQDILPVDLITARSAAAPQFQSLAAMQRDGDFFGYFRIAPDRQSLLIAFRGTQDRREWQEDFEVHGGGRELREAHDLSNYAEGLRQLLR